jgi:2-oxoglutarate dehydrogenase E2 component (dihydrolipoamide succinyltransferase)
MPIEIKVPAVGESITEVEIGQWLKKEGDGVGRDESVVVLETEKATVEVPAPVSGKVVKVLKRTGELAKVGEIIGHMEEGAVVTGKPAATPAPAKPVVEEKKVMPAAARAAATAGVRADQVAGSGPGGRVLKEDIERATPATPPVEALPANTVPTPIGTGKGRLEEVVRMTALRRAAARRLVEAQHTTATLTTFNEIDMGAVMDFRKQHGDAFKEKYKIKLGLMSFFVKATIDALKLVPQVNAEVRGDNIVYRNYCDIGIAVSSEKGLVVPVLRDAERMSFAEIELAIADFGARAQANKLKIDELSGGTFTISNGGVFGSLLSTPIINYPQSGVLGMHTIQERPVARDGAVVIRPMMYVALSYDHRIIDGKEGVSFLKRIKEVLEKPDRMLVEI